MVLGYFSAHSLPFRINLNLIFGLVLGYFSAPYLQTLTDFILAMFIIYYLKEAIGHKDCKYDNYKFVDYSRKVS